jgi:putative SOS response-associated peptidase YedK
VTKVTPCRAYWVRTFAIITTDANEMIAEIHDRMTLIIAPGDCARWLGEEPDPHDLMRPFPAEPMRMWPISPRVNKPENDPRSSSPSIWQALLRRDAGQQAGERQKRTFPDARVMSA